MSNQNTINSLESIQKKTIYSKYGENLDRIFKSRSLRSLIYELKNPKKYLSKEWSEGQEFERRQIKEKKMEENYTDIFNSIYQMRQNQIKKEVKKEVHKINLNNNNKPKKIIEPRSIIKNINTFMDPFKYNPNYNAISKNVPSVKMILTDRERNQMNKMNQDKKNKKLILVHSKTESNDKKNNALEIIDENSQQNSRNHSPKKREIELPPINNNNNSKMKERSISIGNDKYEKNISMKNNHAMRFSKYLSRKGNLSERNKVSDHISYLEPYKYLDNKNNIIDFRKMSSRKPKDFLNIASLEIPSFNNYSPKFDLVEKKMAQVDFSPHNNKLSKKYLLKKLWSSYEVISDYQLVNNAKLS